VDPGLLDQMFHHFLSIEHLPKMAQAAKPVDTVGVIIHRHVDNGANGMSYMKWLLTGMYHKIHLFDTNAMEKGSSEMELDALQICWTTQ
jgi:hypothetical protein